MKLTDKEEHWVLIYALKFGSYHRQIWKPGEEQFHEDMDIALGYPKFAYHSKDGRCGMDKANVHALIISQLGEYLGGKDNDYIPPEDIVVTRL
jgi:hypothetical protein